MTFDSCLMPIETDFKIHNMAVKGQLKSPLKSFKEISDKFQGFFYKAEA